MCSGLMFRLCLPQTLFVPAVCIANKKEDFETSLSLRSSALPCLPRFIRKPHLFPFTPFTEVQGIGVFKPNLHKTACLRQCGMFALVSSTGPSTSMCNGSRRNECLTAHPVACWPVAGLSKRKWSKHQTKLKWNSKSVPQLRLSLERTSHS